MMDERNRLAQGAQADGSAEASPYSTPAAAEAASPQGASTTTAPDATPGVSEAVIKFRSCRWRCDPDSGEFCTHRDVLPFAGKEGFVAESWCPDCAFYKLRRTPKKREYDGY